MFPIQPANKQFFYSPSLHFMGSHSAKKGSRHNSFPKDKPSRSTDFSLPVRSATDSFTNAGSSSNAQTSWPGTYISPQLNNDAGVRDTIWETGYVPDLIFDQWKSKLIEDAGTNDTTTVRAYLKTYPGDKNTNELEPLPEALKIAAAHGRWPTVKLLLEKHKALLAHQKNAYLRALREGFSAAVNGEHASVVQEMLPKMLQLHKEGYSDLKFVKLLQNEFNNAIKNQHWRGNQYWTIVDTILPYLGNNDSRAYANCLCEQIKWAARYGQTDTINHLVGSFKSLKNSHHREIRDSYAETLNESTSSAIAKAFDWDRPEVAKPLAEIFLAVVKDKLDNPAYRETLYNTIRYAAKTGNSYLVKQALPLCERAKRHDSVQFTHSLLSAYWNAKDILNWRSDQITKDEIKEYNAILEKLEPYNSDRIWTSWDERHEYGPNDSD